MTNTLKPKCNSKILELLGGGENLSQFWKKITKYIASTLPDFFGSSGVNYLVGNAFRLIHTNGEIFPSISNLVCNGSEPAIKKPKLVLAY